MGFIHPVNRMLVIPLLDEGLRPSTAAIVGGLLTSMPAIAVSRDRMTLTV